MAVKKNNYFTHYYCYYLLPPGSHRSHTLHIHSHLYSHWFNTIHRICACECEHLWTTFVENPAHSFQGSVSDAEGSLLSRLGKSRPKGTGRRTGTDRRPCVATRGTARKREVQLRTSLSSSQRTRKGKQLASPRAQGGGQAFKHTSSSSGKRESDKERRFESQFDYSRKERVRLGSATKARDEVE